MRWLVLLADQAVFERGPIKVASAGGEKYEVIEDQTLPMTPIDKQHTHCCLRTAESLVASFPHAWQIVEDAEIKELERMYGDPP